MDTAGVDWVVPVDEFEQCALASTIDTNDAHSFTRIQCETYALQHPLKVVSRAFAKPHPLQEARPPVGVLLIGLAQIGNNDSAYQSSSTISPTFFLNKCKPNKHSKLASTAVGQRLLH